MIHRRRTRRPGLSLLELIAVVTILGILAVMVIPRFSHQSTDAKTHACSVNRHNIEVQCQLWLRQKGNSPLSDLSDIGVDRDYFPEGVPTCPVDNSPYRIDTTSQRVIGHAH